MNPIAIERIEACKKNKSEYLNLSNLDLTEIPIAIQNFIWLKILDFSQSKIEKIEGLDKLSQLKALNFYQNKIEKIEGLDKLHQLQILSLHQNKIGKIEGLDKLSQLQILELYQNEIEKIEGLDKLSQLKVLELYQNKIKKIEGLDKLSQLQVLSLYQNKIEKIEGLDKLSQLQTLSLYQNKIGKIEGLGKLSQLKVLELYQNKIGKIERLDKLSQLQVLDFSQNEIEKIEGLDKLSQLEILELYQNKIEKVEGLDKLSQLQGLDLSQNKIEKIEGLDKLSQLQGLGLNNNPIKTLKYLNTWSKKQQVVFKWDLFSIFYSNESNLIEDNKTILISNSIKTTVIGQTIPLVYSVTFQPGIYLKNCTQLVSPSPEWVQLEEQAAQEAIRDYFEAIENQGSVELNEAKLMLVGRPHAGKTTLSVKLRDSKARMPDSDDSTRGVVVEDWKYSNNGKDYTVHLWDFGGQDIQYAIHQFFMTQRAVYVLLDCTRDLEQSSMIMGETKSEVLSNYWLQTIDKLANGSPTFYFYNHYENCVKNKETYLSAKDHYDFLHDETFEVNLHQVDQAKNPNQLKLETFKLVIQEEIAKLPNVGLILPKKWAEIREALLEKSKKEAFLSLDAYKKLCKAHDLEDEKVMLLISRYLHEIGIIIHYSQNKLSSLYNLLILQRSWATEAVYKVILDSVIREENKGHFTNKDLERIWSDKRYQDKLNELKALLERFEICYQLGKSQTYLIPQCLSIQKPTHLQKQLDPVKIEYDYEFMPYGLVNRLAVRLHEHIKENEIWKRGMVLSKGDGYLIIEEIKDFNKGQITLSMSGDKTNRHYLQTRVMEQLDKLNEMYNVTDSITIKVPCICTTCTEKENVPSLHSYHDLLDKIKLSIHKERCHNKPFLEVDIVDLIDHAFEERPKEMIAILEQAKSPFERANIKNLTINIEDKSQTINAEGQATIDTGDNKNNENTNSNNTNSELKNIDSGTSASTKKDSLFEAFHLRGLLGSIALAFGLGCCCYFIPIPVVQTYAVSVFFIVFAIGAFFSLAKERKYLRFARWVLLIGIGAAGLLNALPDLDGTAQGNFQGILGSLSFLTKFQLDDNPLYTILILLLSFGLAGYLIYLDSKEEKTK